MNIKTFMAVAVAALTVAACGEKSTETVDIPANEEAAAQVELNDDGSVKAETVETPAVENTETAK